jgi:hypothetical protein
MKVETARNPIVNVRVGAQILVLRKTGEHSEIWEAHVVEQEWGNGVYLVRAPRGHQAELDTKRNTCALTAAHALSIKDAPMRRPYDGRPITMYTPDDTPKEETQMSDEKPKNADPKTNPPNPKARFGDMKRRVDLVPPALELGAAVALKEGAGKYGPFNWRINHVEAMTYAGAIKRHIFGYIDGEDVDPESKEGKLHLEGIAASCAILLDSHYAGILIDNRPPKGPAPALCRLPAATEEPRYKVVGIDAERSRVIDMKPGANTIFQVIADGLSHKNAALVCDALNGVRS